MQFLICDDHPFVAQALAMSLETAFDAHATVVHRFEDAIAAAAATPDLALCLVDFHIPGEDSLNSLRRLRDAMPGARMLVFSGSDDDEDLRIALQIGAHGFVHKSSPPEVIEAAVRLVLAGGRYLPDRVATLAFGAVSETVAPVCLAPSPSAMAPAVPLTDRQRAVLELVAQGMSNKEIARALDISPATVKAHVAQIIGVLHATNRTQAVANARSAGVI